MTDNLAHQYPSGTMVAASEWLESQHIPSDECLSFGNTRVYLVLERGTLL